VIRFCWRCAAILPGVPPTACAVCGEVHYVNPKPCGNAVVIDGDRVLLLLRAREPAAGEWTVPGGFCEAGEHPRAACERELWEETGLAGRAVAYLGAWMDAYGEPEPDGQQIQTLVSGYLCRLEDPAAPPRPDPAEAREVRWFPLSAPPAPLAFPRHVPAMIAAGAELAAGRGTGPGGLPRMLDA
jgi:ADP-ribose pyrophosphatase YjhB (NUDIX family)